MTRLRHSLGTAATLAGLGLSSIVLGCDASTAPSARLESQAIHRANAELDPAELTLVVISPPRGTVTLRSGYGGEIHCGV